MRLPWSKPKAIPESDISEIFSLCRSGFDKSSGEKIKSYVEIYSISAIENIFDKTTKLNPLMVALDSGNDEVVEALLLSGSDVKRKSAVGFSVFLGACKSKKYIEILHKALKSGSDPNERMGNDEIGYVNSALGLAVCSDNKDAVDLLIKHGAEPSFFDNCALRNWSTSGLNVYHVKVATQETESISLLLKTRGDILRSLVSNGASVDSPTDLLYHCATPLQICLNDQFRLPDLTIGMAKLLCEFGADPKHINQKSWPGKTTLHWCANFRYINFLNEAGVDLKEVISRHFSSSELINLIACCKGAYSGELDFVLDMNFSDISISPSGKIILNSSRGYESFVNLPSTENRIKHILECEKDAKSGLVKIVKHIGGLDK